LNISSIFLFSSVLLRYQQALVRHMPTRETGWKEYLKKV